MRIDRVALGLAVALGLVGCKGNAPSAPAPIVDGGNAVAANGPDPAAANLATVGANTAVAQTGAPVRVLGQRSEAPQTAPVGEQYADDDAAYDEYDAQPNAGEQALYADQAPPPLPEYQQPELLEANDQWTPGYWNYAQTGYYFVPGAWVAPPYAGALWTPPYWGYTGGRYRLHRGFWGRHIGFYGGINYGYGYGGRGYEGGYWNGPNFFYNQRVNRVNVLDVRNVYTRNVVVEPTRGSFNGPGGYNARPVAAELAVFREQRLPPMQVQVQNRQMAAGNREQFFSQNHGRPLVTVASQRLAADRQLPQAIQPSGRGGFGQQGTSAQQVRAQGEQQRGQTYQQRNVQVQQQLRTQGNNQAEQQQRAVQQEQRTAQAQQRNIQQQHGEQQGQRAVQGQQQAVPHGQRGVQQQQQRAAQEQQRSAAQQAGQQQRQQQMQQREQQAQQRTQPQMQQRAQPQMQQQQRSQPQVQQQRAQPQVQQQRSAPAAQPHAEAPHSGEEHGGGRPR